MGGESNAPDPVKTFRAKFRVIENAMPQTDAEVVQPESKAEDAPLLMPGLVRYADDHWATWSAEEALRELFQTVSDAYNKARALGRAAERTTAQFNFGPEHAA